MKGGWGRGNKSIKEMVAVRVPEFFGVRGGVRGVGENLFAYLCLNLSGVLCCQLVIPS